MQRCSLRYNQIPTFGIKGHCYFLKVKNPQLFTIKTEGMAQCPPVNATALNRKTYYGRLTEMYHRLLLECS